MKKIISSLFLIFVLFSLSSCGVIERTGIANYDKNNSEFGISSNLLPADNYLQEFEYIEGDYQYIDKGLLKRETEIMYLVYQKDIYNVAKAFILDNSILSQTNNYSYNDYMFYENIGRKENINSNIINDEFPYRFNMIAFNDDKNTIVFMGLRISSENINETDEQLLTFEDMRAFLEEYFSFYDFDK